MNKIHRTKGVKLRALHSDQSNVGFKSFQSEIWSNDNTLFFFFGSGLDFQVMDSLLNLWTYYYISLIPWYQRIQSSYFLLFSLLFPMVSLSHVLIFLFYLLYIWHKDTLKFFFFACKRGALLRKCPLLILALLIYVHTYLLLRNYIKLNLLMRSSELKLHLYIWFHISRI